MTSTTSLPGSTFRLVAIATLATVAVGSTVVEFDRSTEAAPDVASPAAADETAPTTTTAPMSTVPDDAEDVTANAFTNSDGTPTTTTEPASVETVWRTDDFSSDTGNWLPMSGSWEISEGQYIQSDATGYDLITQYNEAPPTEFAISVEMTATTPELGGGLLIGQPALGSRNGATLIDFTDAGSFLRWGRYDPTTGQHEYLGGLPVDADFDPEAMHTLTVRSNSDRAFISLDGEPFGEFDAVDPGYIGLATSVSGVTFDNLEIVEL